jgi:hypothetical protein
MGVNKYDNDLLGAIPLLPISDDATLLQLGVFGSGTGHWGVVSDSSDGTGVYSTSYSTTINDWQTDRFNLGDPNLIGTITSVTVNMRVARAFVGGGLRTGARTYLRVGGVDYFGVEVTPPAWNGANYVYGEYTTTYTTKPGGSAWTWADINALQAGVSLRASGASGANGQQTRASKVWAVVNYIVPVQVSLPANYQRNGH